MSLIFGVLILPKFVCLMKNSGGLFFLFLVNCNFGVLFVTLQIVCKLGGVSAYLK